jgi:NADH-quinone oxidoreductase subunit L
MEGFLNLAWLVPVPPFLAFVAIVLFLNPNKTVSAYTAIGGVIFSLLLSWPIAFTAFFTPHFGEHPHEGTLFTIPTGATEFVVGYQVDPANALMLFMSSFLLVMIFIYASGYMTFPGHLTQEAYPFAHRQGRDPRYSRFMAYISLFATGMLGLIVANSLLTFFIFWEVMGLCSYLLIGFWYEKRSAQAAAVKAFMTTRIGDVFMFIGLIFLYVMSEPSTLVFSQILSADNLHHIAGLTTPIVDVSWLALIAILIFLGTVGKSAQFPLHVWLPDAMEGPTPVSAMIHAATMVSAGVFLLVRMFPLYAMVLETAPGAMTYIAFTGAFTALFAATIAVAQWDIKRVLAYSTISQLGFMVAAIGIGAYVAALFHLITHAFFKALLFLGSGSVIHGVEHGLHHVHEHEHDHKEGATLADEQPVLEQHARGDMPHQPEPHGHDVHWVERPDGRLNPEDPQDMRNMGGLLGRMPRTAWTFIIGGMALSGFPFITAGFWSKDEILAGAWDGHGIVFTTLAVAAFLTAFYTMRQICLTFLGRPRTEMANHAPESVPQMTIPLILIAPFAILLGFIGIPGMNWIAGLLEPFMEYYGVHLHHHEFSFIPMAVSIVVALGGLGLGWLVYGKGLQVGEIDPVRRMLGPLWVVFHNKYWIDELYNRTVVAFTLLLSKLLYWFDDLWVIDPIVDGVGRVAIWISRFTAAFDRFVIDGIVNTTGWFSARTGALLRNTQDGHVQVYLLVLAVAVTVWLLLKTMPFFLTLV